MKRPTFYLCSVLAVASVLTLSYFSINALFLFILIAPLIVMGIQDIRQDKQSIRRNFPVLGRLRYVFEDLRPKIQQYFIESRVVSLWA